MQIARMNRPVWDKHSERFVINWRFPTHLHVVTDAWFRDRFPKSFTPEQAARRGVEKLAEFNRLKEDAEIKLGTPEGRDAIGRRLQAEIERDRPKGQAVIARAEVWVAKATQEIEEKETLARLAGKYGVALPQVASGALDIDGWLDTWAADRVSNNKGEPSNDLRKQYRSMLTRLLDWARENRSRAHLGAITAADLREYRGVLIRDPKLGKGLRHHLECIRAVFRAGTRNGLLGEASNPAADLAVPEKSEDNIYPPMESVEARSILTAADQAPPVIRWSNWIAAFTTAHPKEILLAEAKEFYRLPAGHPYAGTWVWDMRGRKLKCSYRERITALHPALTENEEFMAYLASREGKPLFDGAFSTNKRRLNDFLHDPKGLAITKTFYSWRKRNTDQISTILGGANGDVDLARYLSGHAGLGEHAKRYRFYDLPENFHLIHAAINALPNPVGAGLSR